MGSALKGPLVSWGGVGRIVFTCSWGGDCCFFAWWCFHMDRVAFIFPHLHVSFCSSHLQCGCLSWPLTILSSTSVTLFGIHRNFLSHAHTHTHTLRSPSLPKHAHVHLRLIQTAKTRPFWLYWPSSSSFLERIHSSSANITDLFTTVRFSCIMPSPHLSTLELVNSINQVDHQFLIWPLSPPTNPKHHSWSTSSIKLYNDTKLDLEENDKSGLWPLSLYVHYGSSQVLCVLSDICLMKETHTAKEQIIHFRWSWLDVVNSLINNKISQTNIDDADHHRHHHYGI